ncbi:ABC transporter ATP-binding protein [Pseudomonas entomophila]|uniref:ABC transporter ATP-binding protein n=1 Tax=Pseudomonas entomophila TaxID=312306 RepID=UPI001F00F7A2|nr:ABC transporter ATP-binding protein [Pseudomonas entomophila]MCG8295871.1 ABC transporter ATP-binding protein [Pseudomonas entomophila]
MSSPLLRIERLHWSPAAGEPRLLDDVTLDVRPGEFVGLIGPNGSGKTSLLRCAYRFNRPLAGRVLLDGEDVWQRPPRWVAQRIAVMLQEFPEDFGLSVRDVVAMGRTPHLGWLDGDGDPAPIEAALRQLGLEDRAEQGFAHLSGGEKQRVLLARALAQQPRLLVLDEPTNHLDPRYQLALLQHLRGTGLGLLASFHDLNLAAAFCDRLYVIEQGRIKAGGTPAEVLTEQCLAEVFGTRALVDRHPLAHHPRITWISPA